MAEVYLGVGIDASEARTGASQFNNATDSISRGAGKATKSTADFQRQLAYAKAALIAFGAIAATQTIRTITEYTAALSAAKAVTGATASEMQKLEQATRQLGATTMFSAANAAEAVKFLGMAGFETTEILAALPSTLDLAAAASLSMGQAADIASNIMSGFGIEASKMVDVADTLASVAANANTDVSQMGEAMKHVGPIAKSLGVSMQDTAAAIGVLSNAGIQGSMAGTGLKTSLSGLLKPSKQAREAIKSLGLTVEQLNPQTHSLSEVIKTLSTAGLDAERSFTIFGQRGATAMLALTDNVPMLDKLTKVTNNASGEAKRMADIMRDNLAGDAQILWSALSELALVMGDSGVTSAIRGIVQSSTEMISAFSKMLDSINKNKEQAALLKDVFEALSVIIASMVLTKAISWFSGLTLAIQATTTAAIALNTALSAFAAVAAVSAILYLGKLAYETKNLEDATRETRDEILNMGGAYGDMARRGEISLLQLQASTLRTSKQIIADMNKIQNSVKLPTIGGDPLAFGQLNEFQKSNISLLNEELSAVQKIENRIKSLTDKKVILNATYNKEYRSLKKISEIYAMGSLGFNIGGDIKASPTSAPKKSDSVNSASSGTSTTALDNMKASAENMIKPLIDYASEYANFMYEVIDSTNRGADEINRMKAANEGVIDSLNQQYAVEQKRQELLKEHGSDMEKINLEMSIYNEQQKLNAQATDTEINKVRELVTEKDKLTKANSETAEASQKAIQADIEWKKQMSSAFKDAIMNSNSLSDALSNLANRVQNMVVDKALDSLLGGLFSGFAKGAAFSGGNVTAYASGGVVNSPTIFPMANGMGLMGEAGPEAVMPLKRDTQGRLGVTMSGGGSGTTVFNSSINIQVESSGDSERDQEHANTISKGVRQELEALVDKRIRTSKRPGGMLYSR